MDDRPGDNLQGYSLAHLTIITHLCRNLARMSPALEACVRKSLDESASKIEDIALRLGEGAPPELTIEALRIVEQTHSGVFGGEGKRGGG
jgi:hypothetical protein